MNAKGNLVLFGIKHPAQFAHRLGKGARDACDHGIALIHLQHQRAKNIAVAVDHALHIAAQIATPLQPRIKPFDHGRHQRAGYAVMDFKAFRIRRAYRPQLFQHGSVAPDQHGRAIAILFELHGSAQHDILFALCKDHTFRLGAGRFINPCHH